MTFDINYLKKELTYLTFSFSSTIYPPLIITKRESILFLYTLNSLLYFLRRNRDNIIRIILNKICFESKGGVFILMKPMMQKYIINIVSEKKKNKIGLLMISILSSHSTREQM